MIDFSYETSKRKRKGIYSEQDIFESSHVFYPAGRGRAEAVFELSSVKNISVTRNLNLSKLSSVINGENGVLENLTMEQKLEVLFIDTPKIEIYMDANISKGCEISYRIFDDFASSYPFTVTEKINNEVVSTKVSSKDGKYTTILTDEQILKLEIGSKNTFLIEISTEGGVVTSKQATFTRINNKPTILVNSYNSNSAKFTASDLDNNLSKIEWYLDDVLKETITTDLTAEKTINYELTNNAIHTLKIVATDTENATVEKVLSISKEIMPLQSDATLQDISTKLVEIGEGFKNGKTSIINTLALKNIEANLNNTLVELSEKIKASFDSGDASLQDLMNQLTQANNTITQLNTKYKVASGTTSVIQSSQHVNLYGGLYGATYIRQPYHWININNLGFVPNIFIAENETVSTGSVIEKNIIIATCNMSWSTNKRDFIANLQLTRGKMDDQDFNCHAGFYINNEQDAYINSNGINVPASRTSLPIYGFSWYAIKFK
ncbi:TPA: hypothetical protein ACXDUQ_003471 [Clostridioides difficile]|uniref:hypothetical protein n=1 Tax=Clostridioides difficile TaxID=1496 RepID=UPI000938E519|nr:hypothetical protein [Clostridioides difficile]EGT4849163.1 hypothetical protein [Clostridioides difficile]MCG3603797.1 hypothetical protein [Clostridioides difficile]MCI9897890.1 hypothetical protein [Clostridioides difficile]MCI9970694.1 hypothetical protein [Clostridioides difficile]MCJ0134453.1 hypothetical protein [Clostridioides difficile]